MLRRQSEADRLRHSLGDVLRASGGYLVALLVVVCLTMLLLWFGSTSPSRLRDEVLVRVPEGSGRQEVADILRGQELIRSRTVFNIIVYIGYQGRQLVPGTYRFRKDMRLFEVLRKLENGDVAFEMVTIPEGFTIKRIAERLERFQVTDDEKFLEMAATQAQDFGIDSPTGSLEGYLFPDTYKFELKVPPERVLRQMLRVFKDRVTRPYAEALQQNDRSLHEVITIASLIERETMVSRDRPLVASVIENRLARDMRLQIDASVIYSLGSHVDRVLYRHLKVESPYNTYLHRGLPPGPIANPGLDSIKAALNPAVTPYLYYVAANDGSNSHLFAETYAEHLANIRKARSR